MWRDLRYVLRSFGHRPSFAIIVIITLALGIGGSTALFTIFNAVLLRDLPYQNPDRIYLMSSVAQDGSPNGPITPVELRPFYEDKHPLVDAAALAWSQEVQIIGSDKKAYTTTRYGVTDQFFEVFDPQLFLGQAFKRGEWPGVIVIAHATWRNLFNSDPSIIGKFVMAEGRQMRVVGVARADFDFPENPGYWYLMSLGRYYDNVRGYRGFIRLRPDCSGEQFQKEVTGLSQKLGLDPATNKRSILVVRPFLEYVVGDLRYTVTILFGATAILLLIACINVTNLLLSRAMIRTREMALREALGARRWRIIRQSLMESLLLAIAGGALGFGCAESGVQTLLKIAPSGLPRLDKVPIDNTVMLFALGVTVLVGIIIGLAPAWRLSQNPIRSLVNEGGRGAKGDSGRTRLFGILVVTEIALAVLLTISAGLLIRNFIKLTNIDPGFNSDRVLTLFMNVPGRSGIIIKPNPKDPQGKPESMGTYAPMANLFRELLDRIRGLNGVAIVATTNNLPLDKYQYGKTALFTLPDQPGIHSGTMAQSAVSESVSPDYFRALEIRVLAGRPFLPSDRDDSPGVAIVNETFARRFFPHQDPLGRHIRYPENSFHPDNVGFQFAARTVDEMEIVGIVQDVRYQKLTAPPEPRIYMSSEQYITRHRTVVVRTTLENPASLVEPIRNEIESMDRFLNAEFALYPAVVQASLARERLATTLLVIFGLAALTLAAVGIYSLMSYSIAQRMGEIAVRSAMGATIRQILSLVMRQGILLIIGGIVLGIIGAVALRKVVAGQLYGVSALDTGVFVVASVILFGVAVLACFVPAYRATRIEPADILRSE
jgi:putative ABC transport system permease protein